MRIIKTMDELLQDNGEFKDYKLCFIDKIPETIFDYTEESKEYMSRSDYSVEKEREKYGELYNCPYIRMEDLPNPEYSEEKWTKFAYFTEKDPKDVDGGDWHRDIYDSGEWDEWGEPYETENNILLVKFNLEEYSYDIIFPQQCVQRVNVYDINNGFCPWIYAKGDNKFPISVRSGVNPYEFVQLIGQII